MEVLLVTNRWTGWTFSVVCLLNCVHCHLVILNVEGVTGSAGLLRTIEDLTRRNLALFHPIPTHSRPHTPNFSPKARRTRSDQETRVCMPQQATEPVSQSKPRYTPWPSSLMSIGVEEEEGEGGGTRGSTKFM
jgi:hypothetical protein